MELLPALTMEAPDHVEVDAAIIWLHGLGADGSDFAPIVPQLELPGNFGIRFVFPNAPAIPVTINSGMVMPAWYDIINTDIDRHVDEDQLRQSARRIQQLIEREIERGIASERILLAGFSQGGAVAYEAALTFPQPLAGLIALSSYLATADSIEINPVHSQLPILVCHGNRDGVVPEILGYRSVQTLNQHGLLADYKTYPMEHAVCPAEIKDIGRFIASALE